MLGAAVRLDIVTLLTQKKLACSAVRSKWLVSAYARKRRGGKYFFPLEKTPPKELLSFPDVCVLTNCAPMVVSQRDVNEPELPACREQLESHDLSQMPLLGEGVDKHDVSVYEVYEVHVCRRTLTLVFGLFMKSYVACCQP